MPFSYLGVKWKQAEQLVHKVVPIISHQFNLILLFSLQCNPNVYIKQLQCVAVMFSYKTWYFWKIKHYLQEIEHSWLSFDKWTPLSFHPFLISVMGFGNSEFCITQLRTEYCLNAVCSPRNTGFNESVCVCMNWSGGGDRVQGELI